MEKKLELLKKYVYGGYEDGITNYKILKEFLGIELDKIPFIELQFSSYKKCYEKLQEIFFDNALIRNYCRNVLNYNKENHTLNQEWDFEARGKYHYRNSIPTQEIRVICKYRKYFLSYRKLDLRKLLEQSPTSQTKSLRDFPNGEHNKD